MKGKQLAFVLILLIALGGVALLLRNRTASSWRSSATESNDRILSFPLNEVSHLTIKSNEGELNLVKKEEAWRVAERADYPADFEKVSTLLKNLWELKPAQDVKAGASQLGRLQLLAPDDPNGGTLIDLKGNGDKRIAALLLGKKHLQDSTQVLGGGGMPAGRYAMSPDRADRVFMISQTFDEVQAKPELWINRDFIKMDNAKSVTVVGPQPGMNWKITRESAPEAWKLEGAKPGEELESSVISTMTSYLGSLGFSDVLAPDAAPAETGLDNPSTITIETFDGFVTELRVGKVNGEAYPVLVSVKADLPNERKPAAEEKPEDKANLDQQFQAKQKQLTEKLAKEQKLAGRAYLIAKAPIEQFLKDRSALLKPPASPSPTPPPAATTLKAKSPSPSATKPPK